jgi:hypothetical protein
MNYCKENVYKTDGEKERKKERDKKKRDGGERYTREY